VVRAALASALACLPVGDLARLADSARLGMSLPGMSEFGGTVEALAGAVGRRAGGECDDFAARMVAGAVIGVIMAAVPRGAEPGADLAAGSTRPLPTWKRACRSGHPHPGR
jgi:hypothetical protein